MDKKRHGGEKGTAAWNKVTISAERSSSVGEGQHRIKDLFAEFVKRRNMKAGMSPHPKHSKKVSKVSQEHKTVDLSNM